MYNSQIPLETDLPSTGTLITSTIIAIVVAGVILATIVLPAEYGIDPTGIGKITGLKRMGEIKLSLAKEAASENSLIKEKALSMPASVAQKITSTQAQSHTMKITLAPDEGAEVKLKMAKGNSAKYAWSTDGGGVNYDVHGDSKKLQIKYHGYRKGSSVKRIEDVIKAAFDGNHGWFWRNRTRKTITITLNTAGNYAEILRLK